MRNWSAPGQRRASRNQRIVSERAPHHCGLRLQCHARRYEQYPERYQEQPQLRHDDRDSFRDVNLATLRKSNTRKFTAREIIRFFLVKVRKSFSEGVRHRPRVKPSHPVPKAGKAAGEMTALGGGLAVHPRKSPIAEWAEDRRRERGVARRRPRLPARLGCGWPECS